MVSVIFTNSKHSTSDLQFFSITIVSKSRSEQYSKWKTISQFKESFHCPLNQGLPVPTYLSPHRPCLDARPLTWWLCLNHVFSPWLLCHNCVYCTVMIDRAVFLKNPHFLGSLPTCWVSRASSNRNISSSTPKWWLCLNHGFLTWILCHN